ncbi:MAG: hypothetical protein RLZZ584_1068 [Pseudomonadota bacterium]
MTSTPLPPLPHPPPPATTAGASTASAPPTARWQFWIDRGGTFTDIVARRPDGGLVTAKLLSASPEHYADAAVEGVRRLLGLAHGEPFTAEHAAQVECVKMGTTVATNALLERQGAPLVLVITRGFRDALRIAYQARPDIFAREIVLPELLYQQVIEADERVGAHGEVERALDEARLRADLQAARAGGLDACAIVFMHGWRHPAHEAAAARIAREIGFAQVSVSHEVSPLIKLVGRGDTTVVDAYLSPILRRYVDQVAAQLPGVALLFMQSSGGLAEAHRFAGKDAILSGPAGGIVGMVRTGLAAGEQSLIGFDMGGTSTDVSHYSALGADDGGESGTADDAAFERAFDTEVAGVRVRAPMLAIHTVAAGGGSIVRFDGARLRVGPQSAGALPGPAAYRRGGPLTVTDANVLLGRVQPAHFPAVFGPNGNEPLDRAAVERGFAELARQMDEARGDGSTIAPAEVAAGALRIAVAQMANAIKRISVARGYDVTRYTLQCFGGAGGQHACAVADALGMQRVLIHPLAGLLSAYGMGLADRVVLRERSVEAGLDAGGLARAAAASIELGEAAVDELITQGASPARLQRRRRLHLRYQGTDTALAVDWPLPGTLSHDPAATLADTLAALRGRFEAAYRQRYAFLMPDKPLVIEAVAMEALARGEGVAGAPAEPGESSPPDSSAARAPAAAVALADQPATPIGRVRLYAADPTDPRPDAAHRWLDDARLHDRAALPPGAWLDGPALITEAHATTVLEPGWRAQVLAGQGEGSLLLTRITPLRQHGAGDADEATDARPDPILLEVFNKLYMNIAEQMGLALQNTASSVNIKERLDFSCALFDAQGQLIANAPHMPVHLGSMSESILSVTRRNPVIRPGEVWALNDPSHGGTHLPDVTVVSPVFLPRQDGSDANGGLEDVPAFFVASRGHHADIGGITPGSMPPFSTTLEEEGICLDNFQLVEATPEGPRLREAELLALLASGPWPARNPQQNLADLRAQIAANHKGARELLAMVRQFGRQRVAAYMRHVQDHAEEAVRRVIGALKDGEFSLPLDNGAVIHVAVTVDHAGRRATIDFSRSSAQLAGNFNAPRAVTRAAVLYVFRSLVDDEIPLNAGCLKPLDIVVPEGSMLNPAPGAAVVAGNVETSSCVTNALYGALGVMAASQCTMNNFTFGNQRHQYYETISGGSGAGGRFDASGRPLDADLDGQRGGFAGTPVVQTHMTNSRLTDPEVLELRFPVRLESYAIRHGSGGAGHWRGGDGGVRRVRFLEAMNAAILSNGRVHGAFGGAGGEAGAPGVNRVERVDGSVESLGALGSVAVAPGDVFVIETPGGGGWGRAG